MLGKSESRRNYSMVSLGNAIPTSSRQPKGPGALALQAVYFFFGLGLPLAQLVLLSVLWAAPLKLKAQRALYVTCEVATAWASLDVFMVAIVMALFEISQFAAFMVGDKCDGLNKLLKKHLDGALDGDDVCFDVTTKLSGGSALLVPAAIISGVGGIFLLRLAHNALEAREARARAKAVARDDAAVESPLVPNEGGEF